MISQVSLILESAPLGATITEGEIALWIEKNNKRKVLFESQEEALDLLHEYENLVDQSKQEFDDKYLADIFVCKGLQDLFKTRYEVKADFMQSGVREEFYELLQEFEAYVSLDIAA